MQKIGYLTSDEYPHLVDDDRLAVAPLEQNGFTVVPVIWDQAHDLDRLDALIFRSCWDYHQKFPAFLKFLDSLRQSGIPVFNPLDVIAWNLNKKHILEFADKLLVPKTKFLAAGVDFSAPDMANLAAEWNADQLVVKPAVSLSGHDTYLVPARGAYNLATDLLRTRDILIQEFIPEIRTTGELSLIFFNKKFSHAVRKVPATGEFRVHMEYGGSRRPTDAPPAALAYGREVLNHIQDDRLYARVDIVESKKGPMLIELELTDPMFYLGTQDIAARNFANAVAATL